MNRSDVLKVGVTTEQLKTPQQHQNGIPAALSIAWNDQTHGKKMPPKILAAVNTAAVNNESLLQAKMPPESMEAADTDAKIPLEAMGAAANNNKKIQRENMFAGNVQGKHLDKTPLRQADVVRSDSQERKRQSQLKQATRIMKQQGRLLQVP